MSGYDSDMTFFYILFGIPVTLLVYGVSFSFFQELTRTQGNTSYPVRDSVSWKFWDYPLMIFPFYPFFRQLRSFPECFSSLSQIVPLYRKRIRTTGKLFLQPKKDALPEEQALFYLNQLAHPDSFLVSLEKSEKIKKLVVSPEKNLVTFETDTNNPEVWIYLLPAESLKLLWTREKNVNDDHLNWSLSYSDYADLYLSDGYKAFRALSSSLQDIYFSVQSYAPGSIQDEFFLQHLDTFKNICETFEESLALQQVISDEMYSKAIRLLENFIAGVAELNQYQTSRLSQLDPNLEQRLLHRLDNEAEVQCRLLPRKSEQTALIHLKN